MTQPVDRYPLERRNEATRWCRCGRYRSLHGGVRICKTCDLVSFMPMGDNDSVEDA